MAGSPRRPRPLAAPTAYSTEAALHPQLRELAAPLDCVQLAAARSERVEEPKLTGARELAVRAEARLCVVDVVERGIVLVERIVVDAQQVVLRVALGGDASGVPDEAAQLHRGHELSVARARRGRDRLVDERAAHVVGARREE